MGWFKNLRLWRRERGGTYLIKDDFASQLNERGNLEIATIFGMLEIDGDAEYDRATGAYDTEYNEFHLAFAGHDDCCNQLNATGNVIDMAGSVIMTSQRQVDLAFFDLLLGAARKVLIRMIRGNKESPAGVGKRVSALLIRAVVYYKAVRKWDKLARLLGIRQHRS